jgi:hypothetical protein
VFSTNNNAFANTGASALLQGTGGVDVGVGTLTNNGGTVMPGNSPGILVINGNYAQTSSGTLAVELGGTTPGSGYDQLLVSGNVSLDGTLNVTFCCAFPGAAGNSYNIITTTAPNGITGNFSTINPPAGTSLSNTTTSSSYVLSQVGGSVVSSSSSLSMQSTNNLLALDDQQRSKPEEEQPFAEQKKRQISFICGPNTF